MDTGWLKASEEEKRDQGQKCRLGPDHGRLMDEWRRIWTSFLGPVRAASGFEQKRAMIRVVIQGP